MKNEPKQMVELLKIYLKEFCSVMGVTEKELSTKVIVYSDPKDKFMAILSVENRNLVKIGVRIAKDGYEILGQYLTEEDKFPQTAKYIDFLNGRNATGNITSPKGE